MRGIEGVATDLIEVSEADAEDIVKLRNDPNFNTFLYQSPLSINDQKNWIKKNREQKNSVNFKVVNKKGDFKGTISIYGIKDRRGEFGRYIVTNPVQAIESEYLLLKYCFEKVDLLAVFCQTNINNERVWKQHAKLGFTNKGTIEVAVGSGTGTLVQAVFQEITREEFQGFDYSPIIKMITSISQQR